MFFNFDNQSKAITNSDGNIRTYHTETREHVIDGYKKRAEKQTNKQD